MPVSERIVSVVTIVVVGLGLSLAVRPATIWAAVGMAVLLLVVCVGADIILRSHPALRRRSPGWTAYVLPCLVVLAGYLFLRLPVFTGGITIAVGLILVGAMLGAVLYAQYEMLGPGGPARRTARAIITLAGDLVAYALFSAIYAPKLRSILSGTGVLIACALLTTALLREHAGDSRRQLYTLVVAVALAEVTWALNYWILNAIAGGVILLLIFYGLMSVILARLEGKLNGRVLLEQATVVAVGFVIVVAGGLWLR